MKPVLAKKFFAKSDLITDNVLRNESFSWNLRITEKSIMKKSSEIRGLQIFTDIIKNNQVIADSMRIIQVL